MIETISKSFIYLLVFLLPIFFFPFTQNVLDFPKQVLLVFLLSLSLIFYFINILLKGKMQLTPHPHTRFLIFFFLAFLLSFLFSKSKLDSLFGLPFTTSQSLFALLYLTIFYFLLRDLIKKEELLYLFFIFSISIFLILIFSTLQLFGKFILPFPFSKTSSFTLVGNTQSFSLLCAIFLPMFFSFALFSKKLVRIFFILLSILSFIFIFLTNFKYAWLFLGIGFIFLLSILSTHVELFGYPPLIFPLFCIAISIIFLFLNIQIFNFPIIPEFSLTYTDSLKIAFSSIKENPILGSGPGTFSYIFALHKPANLIPSLWNIRISNSSSKFFDILSTMGVVGTIFFLLFILSPFIYGILKLRQKDESKIVQLLPFFSSIFPLTLLQFVYPTNLTFEFVYFFLLGALIKSLSDKEIEIDFTKGRYSLVVSFILVFLFSLVFVSIILFLQTFVSEIFYFKGLRSWQTGKIDESIRYLERSTTINPRIDYYYRDLSQAYLAKVTQKVQKRDFNLQEEISRSIEFGRLASQKNKNNVGNWSSWAFVYQTLFDLGVQNADDFALKNWDQALQLDPNNPFFITQKGMIFLKRAVAQKDQEKNFSEAESYFKKAIQVKSDYAPAHYQIALLYDAKGELEKAISKLEETKQFAPLDVGLAFQLGVLYYRKGEYQKAKEELERSVLLVPDYANALYFLGLTYDMLGEKSKAIEKFKRVSELNPEIEEVKTIIRNLEQGKPALEGILQTTPPQTPVSESPPEIRR